MYGVHDAAGRYLHTICCTPAMMTKQTVPAGGGYVEVPAAEHAVSHYVVDGEDRARPVIAVPAELTIPLGGEYRVEGLPAATAVLIDEATAGLVEDGELDIAGRDRGEFRVDLRPPFPWLPASIAVVVS